ncbi:UDP-glucosyltransferase 2-like [Uranotaenia lowii]|uniref:UDP-glucosyltransferase 2-like n=1 Tax=Uranotaenia lowii TaxID=190385 RepID=UPI002478F07C|nr:UDP-glucosyltransferase 2-like [Uranotaenia lowii]
MWLLLVFTILFACDSSRAANILYLNGIPSPSHFIWNRSLMYGLAAKGHNVTALSVDIDDKAPPNVSFIQIEGVYEFMTDSDDIIDYLEMTKFTTYDMLTAFSDFCIGGCLASLNSKGLEQLLAYPDDFKFDLIISDFLQGPCLSPVAQHKFKYPPLVLATGFHGLTLSTSITGAYSYPGSIPNHEYDVPENMNYKQRFMNFLYSHYEELLRTYHTEPTMDGLIRQIMPDIPYVADLDKNARVVLLNSNPVIQYSESAMPNLISVGGMQISSPKELPVDLKTVIESAENGAILFSLGTNVRSDSLGKERIVAIVNAMAKFPQFKFLWKFESDKLPIEIPPNVYIRKWMPQNDILAHPNIKLFITHSGLLSTQEAIWYGVPLIGFPIFADQNKNINYCVQQGVGIRLSIDKLNTKDLAEAIETITSNPS